MAYAAWSVVAGEQPTASKWNLLGTNDASFNDGTGIGTNAIVGASLATSAIKLGYAQITSNFGTANIVLTDVTSLAATVTVPAGGRDVEITVLGSIQNTTAGNNSTIAVTESTTVLEAVVATNPATNGNVPFSITAKVSAPSAGAHTYKVQLCTNAGTATLLASNTPGPGLPGPAAILVKAI